jgi:hypothetical protein
MKNDLFIETMNVDVFWEDHPEPETLLNKTSEEIRTVVLKALEAELEKQDFSGTADIDSLNISLSVAPDRWKHELTQQLVRSITSEVIKENPTLESSDTNASIDHNSWEVKTLVFFEQDMLTKEDAQALWTSLESYWSEAPNKFVSLFLTNAKINWLITLIESASISFFKVMFQSMRVTPQLIESYCFLKERLSGTIAFEKILLPVFVAPKDADYILEEWAKELQPAHSVGNSSIMKEFQTHFPQVFEQFQKAKLREASKEIQTDWLETISKLPSSELRELITSLTDVAKNHTKLLRSLIQFFKQRTAIAYNDFWVLYPSYLKSARKLAPVLQELRLSRDLNRVPALQQIMQQLEAEKKSVSKDSALEKENEELIVKYAGIVLLNPFLPTLFRTFNLLNERNEWDSLEAQITAMYLLNFVASGSLELEEESWEFFALIVGLDSDESYREIEEEYLKEQLPTESLERELEGLLQVVRDNWRPMRNASFPGLRRDFLIRTGTLRTLDTSDYELDMEPHALDVMLPLRAWGISPVVYSWMDAVIYVNWK